MTTPSDFAPVREGEQIDAQALAAYLRGKLEGVEAELTVRQFPGGHSNLTYLLEAGGREYVLRRPPLGPVAPKAHDMAREYNVLGAVHPFFPQAPRVFLLCDDPAVIGAIFFVMERRRGLVLRREIPSAYAGDPGFGGRVSEAFVDCLAALHAVDVNRVTLGKPAGFLERQVNGWAERWQRAQTETLPQMDQLIRWLTDRLPESPAPTLVHNDYKLDNLMLDANWAPSGQGRVEAVLDWEMATVGDPLVDLGCVMCYWPEAGDPPVRRDALSAITTLPGWYTRQQLVERYARITGRDVSGLGYYEVFGIFKIAVVLQQIYFRYHRGQTRDERFRNFDERVRGLVEIAATLAGSVTEPRPSGSGAG
jgi:aminoglycoside phosphotransferase (APT) family kinase protein